MHAVAALNPASRTAPVVVEDSLASMTQHLDALEARAAWASQQFAALMTDIHEARHGLVHAEEQTRRLRAANMTLAHRMRGLAADHERVRQERDVAIAEREEMLAIARRIAEAHTELEARLEEEQRCRAQLTAQVKALESMVNRV